MNLTVDFKTKVVNALKDVRTRYGGKDDAFAKQWGINGSVWNRIKNGELEGLLRETKWLDLGRELNVSPNERQWNLARTEVFEAIRNDVEFCQAHSKAMILVDDCEIGKTFSAKYLSKTLSNCFYVDASQAITKQSFIRAFAKAIGVDSVGKFADIKANIKYYLRMLVNPIVIIDEAGDLDYNAFLTLKEFWNATDGTCGWYMMGADGLRDKIEKGINGKKVGFREILSRYSGKFMKIVPVERSAESAFYNKLITDVLSVNIKDKSRLTELVKKCLIRDENGKIGGLRRAETLLILNAA